MTPSGRPARPLRSVLRAWRSIRNPYIRVRHTWVVAAGCRSTRSRAWGVLWIAACWMCSTHCVLRPTSAVLSLEFTSGAVGGRRCRGDRLAIQGPAFESKRRSLEVEHLAVVQDAVDQGGGQTRILDDGRPFGQALVGRQQSWTFFVPASDQLIQRRAETWQRRQIPQLVDHEDVARQQRPQDPLSSGAG